MVFEASDPPGRVWMTNKVKQEVKTLNHQCEDLLISKNKDYSSDNLIKTGSVGIASRVVDKAHRLFNLSQNEKVNHESVKDTIMDLINYAHLYNIESQQLLKPKYNMVFLSGPIDDVDGREASSWRDTLSRMLLGNGIASFNPYLAFKLEIDQKFIADKVISINKAAIDQCDLLIANLNGPGRAFGTIREIEYARLKNIPVIIIGDVVSLSAHDCVVLKDFKELYEFLGMKIDTSKENK